MKHLRTCFRTNIYRQQKVGSWVTSTTCDCSNTDDQYWYTYSNCAHTHITYPKACICNALRAVKNRQCCHISDYNPDTVLALYKWVDANINLLFPISNFESYSQIDWLESIPHRKRIRKQQGIDVNNEIGFVESFKTHVVPIMKMEPLNSKDINVPFKLQQIDPRLVSGREQQFDVIGGPRVKKISKILSSMWSFIDAGMDAIHTLTGITYYSTGHNKVSIGRWMDKQLRKLRPRFYETDYERFDASTIDALMALEACVYLFLHPDDSEFEEWLSTQLDTNGTLSIKAGSKDPQWQKVVYFCRGTRKSGDQNTSVGNTIVNILVQLYVLSVTTFTGPMTVFDALNNGTLDLLVLGDDTVICIDGIEIPQQAYVTKIRELGLVIKLIQKSQYNVTFCSSYFVPAVVDGLETHILTQKLGRNLSRAYNSHLHYNTKITANGWVKSNAYAYMKDYQHIPFMYHWHQVKYNALKAYKAIPLDGEEYHVSNDIVVGPSDNLFIWFNSVYNVYELPILESDMDWTNVDYIFNVDIYGQENFRAAPFALPADYLVPNSGLLKVVGGSRYLESINPNIHVSYNKYKRKFKLPTFKLNVAKPVKYEKSTFSYNFMRIARISFDFVLDTMQSLVNMSGYPVAYTEVPDHIDRRHPTCRGERMLFLTNLLNYFNTHKLRAFDIGSRMSRNRMIMQLNKWKFYISGCQPNIGTNDIMLDNYVSAQTLADVIKDEIFLAPTVGFSVDVLYYLTPEEIIQFLSMNNITDYFSIHSKFNTLHGSLANGEVTWNTDQDDITEFKVLDTDLNNNPILTTYKHPTLIKWYENNVWTMKHNGRDVSVKWDLVESGNVYDVFRFHLI
jgi:hypothetical protein